MTWFFVKCNIVWIFIMKLVLHKMITLLFLQCKYWFFTKFAFNVIWFQPSIATSRLFIRWSSAKGKRKKGPRLNCKFIDSLKKLSTASSIIDWKNCFEVTSICLSFDQPNQNGRIWVPVTLSIRLQKQVKNRIFYAHMVAGE